MTADGYQDASPNDVDAAEVAEGSTEDRSCGLHELADRLAHSDEWTWLGQLSVMVHEIWLHSASCPVQRPSESSLLERYRALMSVSSALARALGALRSHMALNDSTDARCALASGAGLPRWQVRQVHEFLAANIGQSISIQQVAAACGLSRSYFSCAFRRSTGMTPHHYLLRLRVAKAKKLLASPLPIAEIALACGFSDQSHLTRVFARQTGLSPGVWRRERGLEDGR